VKCEILTVDDWEEDDTKGAKSCSVDSKHPLWDLLSLAILPFRRRSDSDAKPQFLIDPERTVADSSHDRADHHYATPPRRKRFCTTSEMAGMVAALDPLSSSTRQGNLYGTTAFGR